MLIVGEVQTGLLMNSRPLTSAEAARTLALLAGGWVRQSERPIAYSVSPELLTGVDCRLGPASGAGVRGMGTVLSRAAITGGQVLQGSAYARLDRAENERRLPWQHYLSRPGVVEAVGKIDWEDVGRGYSNGWDNRRFLDLSAIAARCMNEVQGGSELDHLPPYRTARTRLRWAVRVDPDRAASVTFCIDDQTVRTLVFDVPAAELTAVAHVCEDLALHDWLLTTLLLIIERSQPAAGPSADLGRLRVAVDHLIHLWMPAARLDRPYVGVWDSLDRRAGFTRQWQVSVDRIRDVFTSQVLAMLSAAGNDRGDHEPPTKA